MAKDKNKGGRPEIEIDFDLVEKMCTIQCTGEEIAAVLNVDYDTLCRRIKKKFNISFAEYFAQKSAGGRMSLRRKQFELALNGNTGMLVWLGKNVLGQVDKTELSGNEEHPLLPASFSEFVELVTAKLKQRQIEKGEIE